MTDILTYDPERACPKCEHPGRVDRYGEYLDYIRGGFGDLLTIATPGSQRRPHLVIRCVGCGWEWLSETKDAIHA